MRPFRSRSAASLSSASTKYWANRVSLRSPPVLVAVTIVRPGLLERLHEGAARTGRVDEDDALVGELIEQLPQSATVRSGPGRLNAASLPSKLPCPMSSTNTSSPGLALAAASVTAFVTFSRVDRAWMRVGSSSTRSPR